ncbi:MAG: class I SAM-dependent methyltransferase [Nanoarchaeota archaeon]
MHEKDQLRKQSAVMKEGYYVHNVRESSPREIHLFWKELHGCTKVLDAGCGIGLFGKFKPKGVEVHGLDNDAGAITHAKRWELAIVHDLKKKLPYAGTYFDAILAKDILEHMQEPWTVVKEMKRILKKGGIVLATVPAPSKKAWDDYTHVRPFTKRAIRELFTNQGFEIVFIKPIRGIPGFGKLGLSNLASFLLKIPGLSLFTQGYTVKARKP